VRAAAALAALLAAALAAACGDDGDAAPADEAPELEVLFRIDGLAAPRGVAWDSARGRWLVTVAGDDDPAGAGRVAAVGRDGQAVDLRAYGGGNGGVTLDTPRGIAARGDRAYVVDGRRVVALDLSDRELAFELDIPGEGPLHDVAVDERGILFVSDPSADAVYRVAPDGSGWNRLGSAGSLRGPSGLLAEPTARGPDRVLAAGRGGAVMALEPDSSVTLLAEAPGLGDLDGLQRTPDGDLLVTEPSEGRLLLLRSEPGPTWRPGVAWLEGLERPADFLLRDGVLAVPEAGAGRVTFYRVAG
jgi:glucose/arabinose dehydrogenase